MGYKTKEEMREYNRQYYIKNKEKELARGKLYVEANRDRILENKKKNHRQNAAVEKEQKAKWYADRKEERIAYSVGWMRRNPGRHEAWKAKNKDKVRAARIRRYARNPRLGSIYFHNRKARVTRNGGSLSKGIAKKLLVLQKGKCACCRMPLGGDYHLDHIMPLALGGRNEDSNMQLLRKKCNLQKHARHPVDFMQARGFLC